MLPNSLFYDNCRLLGGARPGTESYPPNGTASSVLRPEVDESWPAGVRTASLLVYRKRPASGTP